MEFVESDIIYSQRFQALVDSNKYGAGTYEIHWLSIVDSFILVLLLVIFVAVLIVRLVRKDIAQILMDKSELESKEEVGWKKITNDVFRSPM